MARIPMNCPCGWNFFISDGTPGWQVACPSCGRMVPIPGRAAGKSPESHADIAREKARRRRSLLWWGAGVGAAAVMALLIFLTSGGGESPPSGDARTSPAAGIVSLPPAPGTPAAPPAGLSIAVVEKPVVVRDAPPPPPPTAENNISSLRRSIDQLVPRINMAGIVSEIFRYRGQAPPFEQARQRMNAYEDQIRELLGRLAERGDQYPVPAHLGPADRMVTFGDRDLIKMNPRDAAAHIERWLHEFSPGTLALAEVLRGTEKLRLTFYFPEADPEIKSLIQWAIPPDATPLPATPAAPAAAPPVTDLLEVPQDLVRAIRLRFDALPPGYRRCLPPDEADRLERLLRTSLRVFREDVDFLRERIAGEVLPLFEAEHRELKEKVRDLEARIASLGSTDIIRFKDGRKVEGKVEEETDEYVKIKSRFGAVKVPRGDIEAVERGRGAGNEFPDRLKKAQGNPALMTELLAWCKEKNLPLHREYVSYLILAADPLNDRARAEINRKRPITAPPGAPPPEGNEAVSRRIEMVAADAVGRTLAFAEIIDEIRNQTADLKYTLPVPPPEKFGQVCQIIQSPLTFQPRRLPEDQAALVQHWWNSLPTDERRQFAHFYGLWCAYARQAAPPR